ncbi:hypothetical protein ES703_04935 [subsurface metagenome]
MPIRLVLLTGDALLTDVKAGKTFFRDSKTAKKTGTLPTKAIVAGGDTYEEGYHAGDPGGLSAIDADLAPANIKKDVNIFGKVGTLAEAPAELTVADFQVNPATGNFPYGFMDDVNDNNPASWTKADGINQYAEIDLGAVFLVKQYRTYGEYDSNSDGKWKLQTYYIDTWYDWIVDIPTRDNSWSSFASGITTLASKIRLVCTGIDSGENKSQIGELEVKY